MFKEILIGIGAGAAILMVGAGVVIAQRPSLTPAQEAAALDAQIVAIARQAGTPGSGLDRLRQHLASAELDQTRSVRSFCEGSADAELCRTEQYAGNRAVTTLYRQVVLRSDEMEAQVANLCTETETHDGLTDWRGTIDCFVSARQRIAQIRSAS